MGVPEAAVNVEPGTVIPPWSMEFVDPARMRTMAALLRDPYPVHWDREGNAAIGLAGRVINQGPLNLGYLVNMLLAWAGPASIRRLTVSFGRPVLDGDHVVAFGEVRDLLEVEGEARAVCDVRLQRGNEVVVSGSAVVAIDVTYRR
jgi:acyl dehydratase